MSSTYFRIKDQEVVSYNSSRDFDDLVRSFGRFRIHKTFKKAEEALKSLFGKKVKAEKKDVSKDFKYILTKTQIHLTYKGETKTVKKTQGVYKELKEYIKNRQYKKAFDSIDKKKAVESNEGLKVENDKVKMNNIEIPENIEKKIIDLCTDGKKGRIAFSKFYKKLLKNSDDRAIKYLFDFMKHNGMMWTEDGDILAYKSVRHDFKDHRTGNFDNRPGKIVEMKRSEVDKNPNSTCSNGLHAGSYEYAKDFCNGIVVEIIINPKDICCVPYDYEGQKMRCCRYRVLRVCDKPRKKNNFVIKVK